MPLLYSLVFGEGVVNDATSIVLLRAVLKLDLETGSTFSIIDQITTQFCYLFLASLGVGVSVGLLSAIVVRYMFKAHSTDREVFVVVAFSFLSYLLADAASLSGIFSVFFCGITMSHYTWHSLSPSAKVITLYIFRIMAFVAETFLFLYSGFDMWGVQIWRHTQDQVSEHDGTSTQTTYILPAIYISLILLFAVLIARFAFVMPATLLVNTWRKEKIHWREALVIWWGGAFRGAITVALVYSHFQDEDVGGIILITSSIAVVIITSVGGSLFTSTMVEAILEPLSDENQVQQRIHSYPDDLRESLRRDNNNTNGGQNGGLSVQIQDRSDGSEDSGDADVSTPREVQKKLQNTSKGTVMMRIWKKLDKQVLQQLFGGRSASYMREDDQPFTPVGELWLARAPETHPPPNGPHANPSPYQPAPYPNQQQYMYAQNPQLFRPSRLFSDMPGDLDRNNAVPWNNPALFREDSGVVAGDLPAGWTGGRGNSGNMRTPFLEGRMPLIEQELKEGQDGDGGNDGGDGKGDGGV